VSTDVRMSATARNEFGKGASRRFRREGTVPAVMYGSGSELRHLVLPGHELHLALRIPRVVLDVEIDGSRVLVAPRDVQRDAVRQDLLHLDLNLLSDAEVNQRHAYGEALAKAEAAATEAGLDPFAAAALIEEAAANEEDLNQVADNVVELLEEQDKVRRAEAAAAAAREEEKDAEAAAEAGEVEAAEAGETADEDESAE
jgi:ribosomal protein L25 (general stress protein Ctc)